MSTGVVELVDMSVVRGMGGEVVGVIGTLLVVVEESIAGLGGGVILWWRI